MALVSRAGHAEGTYHYAWRATDEKTICGQPIYRNNVVTADEEVWPWELCSMCGVLADREA